MNLLLLAVLLLAPEAAQTPAPNGSLKVATFNIRFDTEKDGDNQWSKRTDLVYGTVRKMDPDLMGVQEAVAHQFDAMKAALPEYEAMGVGRDDGKRAGEFVPVFYKKARFEKLEEGTFWLSETPDVAGSRGWDAALPRVTTWVRLKDRSTGKSLLFANTHFDHKGVQARRESAKLMRAVLEALRKGDPVIVVGDFNADEDGPAYATMVGKEGSPFRLIDSYRAVHPERSPEEASFNGFEGKRTGNRIDWILHSTEFSTLKCEIVRDADGKRYPSDHYPVYSELTMQK